MASQPDRFRNKKKLMRGLLRMKRVTDPLGDKAKAGIIGQEIGVTSANNVSSESEHSVVEDGGLSTPCFSDLFFGTAADDSGEYSAAIGEQDLSPDPSMYDSIDANFDLINRNSEFQMDSFKKELESHVGKAVQIFGCIRPEVQIMQRNVMAYLRNHGYDAAICKTKWKNCGGLTAGNHEFIDVLRPDLDSARYIIDLDFAAEFVLVRPTDAYERLLEQLPQVFVGTADELKHILKVMSAAARSSLKFGNLHVPPWRKHRFMVSMWFGPYRRTANAIPASFSSASPTTQSYGVKCRAVGFEFNASVNGGPVLLPLTAVTR